MTKEICADPNCGHAEYIHSFGERPCQMQDCPCKKFKPQSPKGDENHTPKSNKHTQNNTLKYQESGKINGVPQNHSPQSLKTEDMPSERVTRLSSCARQDAEGTQNHSPQETRVRIPSRDSSSMGRTPEGNQTLSDEIVKAKGISISYITIPDDFLYVKNVKNFIKELLKKPCDCGCCVRYKILIKEKAGKI